MNKFLGLVLLFVSTASFAQFGESARQAGSMEFTIGPMMAFSTSANGPQGSSFDIDDEIGLQGGFDWFFRDGLSVGFDMSWASPDYDAVIVPDTGPTIEGRAEADVFTGQFNLAWYPMDGHFTPYVEGSMGWTYFDTNILDGAPSTGCWWDPWWGYICANFYDTYDETSFSYGLAAGLRWDFGYNTFAKASYRWLKADVGEATSDPDVNSLAIEFGWRF